MMGAPDQTRPMDAPALPDRPALYALGVQLGDLGERIRRLAAPGAGPVTLGRAEDLARRAYAIAARFADGAVGAVGADAGDAHERAVP